MSINSHKTMEKQNLKSSSMLALFCLVGFALAVIAIPWNHQTSGSQSAKTLQRAEIVGYQLVQLYREASKNIHDHAKSARGPASARPEIADLRTIGTMGLDDWGQPYHYRILSTDQNKLRVLIWSSGPDRAVQTTELESEEAKLSNQPVFAGDDLGVMMSMSVN